MRGVMLLCVCLGLMAVVPSSEAYHNRVPVNEAVAPNLCRDMVPTGHGVAAQTVASPFEVVTNQACYKAGQQIQVVVRTKDGQSTEIEGLFVQARPTGNPVTSKGYFNIGSNGDLALLTCTGFDANSAFGHNKEIEKTFKSVMWNPPAGFQQQMKFRATVVKHKTEFWVGLESGLISYDANCKVGATISGSSILHAAPYCLALALVSFIVALFAQ